LPALHVFLHQLRVLAERRSPLPERVRLIRLRQVVLHEVFEDQRGDSFEVGLLDSWQLGKRREADGDGRHLCQRLDEHLPVALASSGSCRNSLTARVRRQEGSLLLLLLLLQRLHLRLRLLHVRI
jgi:hypothetical protein